MGEFIIIGALAFIVFAPFAAVVYGAGLLLLDAKGCKEAGLLKIISTGVTALALFVLGLGLLGFIIKQVGAVL